MSSFSSKDLRLTLTLSDQNTKFASTGSNVLVLSGLWTTVNAIAVKNAIPQVSVDVIGMSLDHMQALTVLFVNTKPYLPENTLMIEIYDGVSWHKFFEGGVTWANPDYNQAPNVVFHIFANVIAAQQNAAVKPSSYPNDTKIVTIANDIATETGYALSAASQLVTGTLAGSLYFAGTPVQKLEELREMAHLDYYLSHSHKTLTIVEAGGIIAKNSQFTLNLNTGLIGWPVLERGYLTFKSLYNPVFADWQTFYVTSAVANANGLWSPVRMSHVLSTQVGDGSWYSLISAVRAPS